MKRIKIRKEHFYRIAVIFAAMLVFSLLLFAVNKITDNLSPGAPEEDDMKQNILTIDGKEYKQKENLETVLFIGIDEAEKQQDSEGYNNPNQADFLYLLTIDHDSKSYTGLQINRDTMTEIPVLGLQGKAAGSITGQLALAYTYGSGLKDSCRNTRKAVSRLLYGAEINQYMSLSMSAVGKLNDAVGGVTVPIEDDFSAADPELIQGTEMKLSAEQAQSFVRARGSMPDSTNINRMHRQKVFMDAWQKQALDAMASDQHFLPSTILAISDQLVSSMTADRMAELAEYLENYENRGIKELEGKAVKGKEFMEFYTDDNAVKDFVIHTLCD